MIYKNFLFRRFFLLFCFSISAIALLFLARPQSVLAACDPSDDPNSPDCVCPVGSVTYVDDSFCSTNNVFKPANTCDQSTFVFTYQKCARIRKEGTYECSYTYAPITLPPCSAVDRCYDPSIGNVPGSTGGGGASGSNSSGVILPGICDATKFNGSDPNTACVAGSHYKQCCTAPSPGLNPPTSCSAGVCPDANAFITSPNDTSCDTCTPDPNQCNAPTPACGQTTTGIGNCGACSKTGPLCPLACTVDIKANGSDGPITITIPSGASGASASLTWTSSNDVDNSLGASGSWTGTKSTSNTTGESTGLRAAGTYSYALTCNGTDGVERSNTVTVNVTTTPKKCSELQPGATCKTPGANETCTLISGSKDCPTSCYTCVPIPPGSCSLSTTNVTSTSATVQATDGPGVTGFNKTNWYFGTTNPPDFAKTVPETSWTFDLLTPNTKYYVKAERWNDPNHIPADATCQGNTGTGSSSVESFTTRTSTGTTPPPGGGGGTPSCWWWPRCCNNQRCDEKKGDWGGTKFIEGTTTSCDKNDRGNWSLTGCTAYGIADWGCGTCAAPPPPGGSSCTTGWNAVGSYAVSCGTPVPGGFMAKQIRTEVLWVSGNDDTISWKSQGSTGGQYNTTDGSTYDLGDAASVSPGDTPRTVYWGTDKLISGGTFRVGCNDGESMGISVERCLPTCDNTAPSAPTLSSPGNGSSVVSSPVTLTFSHNGNYGTACAGGNNRLKVYAGVGSPSSVVCDLPPGSTSCQTTVSDGQNYQWKVQATNGALSSDSATWAFSVLFNSGGWFQVQDSDVTSPGDLISRIPLRCTGSCLPQFGLSGGGGYPGVPAYGGSNADFGGGSVSLKEWLANTRYSGRRYDYAWFAKLAPSGVFTNPESVITDSQISGGDLVSGFASGGYFWRYKNGDLTVNGTANMGDRKVILFVNGNLTLQGKINLDDGKGFFAAITSGNINIDPTVSQPNNPALEGIFMANGTISTGTKSPNADDRLYVRGALVGWGGIALQRDLDPNKTSGANNLEAAEYVEYAPDLILTFPRELLREGIVWKEVAP